MLSEIFFHKIIGSGPLFCSIGYIGSVRGKSKKSLIPDLQKDRHEGIVTCHQIYKENGWTPGLGDGSLAFKSIPIFSPWKIKKSPKAPQNGKFGVLWRECNNVPKMRLLWKRMLIFELKSQVAETATLSAIFFAPIRFFKSESVCAAAAKTR